MENNNLNNVEEIAQTQNPGEILVDKSVVSSSTSDKIKQNVSNNKSNINNSQNEEENDMQVYDESAFSSLKNMDNVVKTNKLITIACIVVVPIVVIAFLVVLINTVNKSNDTIYVLRSEGVDEVRKTTVRENRGVECEMHLRKFYELMNDLDPDRQAIEKKLSEAMALGGKDIKRFIDVYKESGFYNQLIQENIFMRGEVDSIRVFTDTYPYKAIVYGRQVFKRYSNQSERSLNFSCTLSNTRERTKYNPHALFINRLVVLDNTELKK